MFSLETFFLLFFPVTLENLAIHFVGAFDLRFTIHFTVIKYETPQVLLCMINLLKWFLLHLTGLVENHISIICMSLMTCDIYHHEGDQHIGAANAARRVRTGVSSNIQRGKVNVVSVYYVIC